MATQWWFPATLLRVKIHGFYLELTNAQRKMNTPFPKSSVILVLQALTGHSWNHQGNNLKTWKSNNFSFSFPFVCRKKSRSEMKEKKKREKQHTMTINALESHKGLWKITCAAGWLFAGGFSGFSKRSEPVIDDGLVMEKLCHMRCPAACLKSVASESKTRPCARRVCVHTHTHTCSE